MKAHPAADLFPMLPDHALRELARDIEANGLREPICVWNGMIVDGRNRMAAVAKTMRTPVYREMEFADDAECIRFIISTNIHRRHLSESQRASIATELAKLGDGQRSDRQGAQICAPMTQGEAAELMQVSRRSVQLAREVQEKAPDLAAQVKAGTLKVSRAATMARERVKAQTDPDQAADSVIDATAQRTAEGDTKRARAFLAYGAALDDTEKTFVRKDVATMFSFPVPK